MAVFSPVQRASQQTGTGLHSQSREGRAPACRRELLGVYGDGKRALLPGSKWPTQSTFNHPTPLPPLKGGHSLHGPFLFLLGSQCLTCLLGTWNFTHDFKTTKEVRVWALLLRPHPIISRLLDLRNCTYQCLPPGENTEGWFSMKQEGVLTRHRICQCLDLGLPHLQNWEMNVYCLSK